MATHESPEKRREIKKVQRVLGPTQRVRREKKTTCLKISKTPQRGIGEGEGLENTKQSMSKCSRDPITEKDPTKKSMKKKERLSI